MECSFGPFGSAVPAASPPHISCSWGHGQSGKEEGALGLCREGSATAETQVWDLRCVSHTAQTQHHTGCDEETPSQPDQIHQYEFQFKVK